MNETRQAEAFVSSERVTKPRGDARRSCLFLGFHDAMRFRDPDDEAYADSFSPLARLPALSLSSLSLAARDASSGGAHMPSESSTTSSMVMVRSSPAKSLSSVRKSMQ